MLRTLGRLCLSSTIHPPLERPPPAGPVSLDGDLTDGDQEQRLIKDGSGKVDFNDFFIFADNFGKARAG